MCSPLGSPQLAHVCLHVQAPLFVYMFIKKGVMQNHRLGEVSILHVTADTVSRELFIAKNLVVAKEYEN